MGIWMYGYIEMDMHMDVIVYIYNKYIYIYIHRILYIVIVLSGMLDPPTVQCAGNALKLSHAASHGEAACKAPQA